MGIRRTPWRWIGCYERILMKQEKLHGCGLTPPATTPPGIDSSMTLLAGRVYTDPLGSRDAAD